MENALVNYRTEGGLLNKLEIRGALEGQLSHVDARRDGNVTNFNFQAANAGATLAMVKIYDKMQGGKLNANLSKSGNGPYQGGVKLKKFTVQGRRAPVVARRRSGCEPGSGERIRKTARTGPSRSKFRQYGGNDHQKSGLPGC